MILSRLTCGALPRFCKDTESARKAYALTVIPASVNGARVVGDEGSHPRSRSCDMIAKRQRAVARRLDADRIGERGPLTQLTRGEAIPEIARAQIRIVAANVLLAAFPGNQTAELALALKTEGLLHPRGIVLTAGVEAAASLIYQDTNSGRAALEKAAARGGGVLARLLRLLKLLATETGVTRLHSAIRLYPPGGSIARHADEYHDQERTVTTVSADPSLPHAVDFFVCESGIRGAAPIGHFETVRLKLPPGASCYCLGSLSSGRNPLPPAARGGADAPTVQHRPSPARCWVVSLVADFPQGAAIQCVLRRVCERLEEGKR